MKYNKIIREFVFKDQSTPSTQSIVKTCHYCPRGIIYARVAHNAAANRIVRFHALGMACLYNSASPR